MPGECGFVIVDKEAGWTSHDVVARLRGIFKERRVGHGGTLDPPATGVLVVAIGRATRLLRYLSATTKEYVGEVVLGSTTTTLDSQGEVTERFDMQVPTLEQFQALCRTFVGETSQRVPLYSAVKVGGERLHRLARAGKDIERPVRNVVIERLVASEGSRPGTFTVEVRCSAGTYVRAIAADLGQALGGGAHLGSLRRVAVGPFGPRHAMTIGMIAAALERGDPVLWSPSDALPLPKLQVDAETARRVRHGRAIAPIAPIGTTGSFGVIDETGALLGVYSMRGAGSVPEVILAVPERR
ncbi:MAG: tRNA pseudouridine(55) synthase TruB [Acidimicrobiales bacterium]